MFDAAPLITLLIAAILLYTGGRLARRARLPESLGIGLTLGVLGVVGVTAPANFIQWAKGSSNSRDTGEFILTIMRAAGVAGLLFIAGAGFKRVKERRFPKLTLYLVAAGITLIAITSVVLVFIGKQQTGIAVTVAAIFAASSLWLTGELSNTPKEESAFLAVSLPVSAALAMLAALAVHLFIVIGIFAGKLSAAPFSIVITYELVKIAVFFGFAYFITTRFLNLSENRIGKTRSNIAYIIISILLFVLAARTIGQLAAFAWAFIAGTVWNDTEAGRRFAAGGKSVATALLLSFSFVPLFLQTHGRTVSNWALLLLIVIAALVVKFALFGVTAWIAGEEEGGNSDRKSGLAIAALLIGPVEILPAFLGIAVTVWDIGGELYFGLLTFTLLSMIAGPLMRQAVAEIGDERNAVYKAQADGNKKRSKAKKHMKKQRGER